MTSLNKVSQIVIMKTDMGSHDVIERRSVHVVLYGDIARYGGGKHIASLSMDIEPGAVLGTLYDRLELPRKKKGYVFVNSVLCDAPGLNASEALVLRNGDHVGIFSETHMWPYQYRDGIRMSDALRDVLQERGAMHHAYNDTPPDK